MKTTKTRKLALSTETLRELTRRDMGTVAGGFSTFVTACCPTHGITCYSNKPGACQ